MRPEDYAKESEHSHQVALFIWAAMPETAQRWPELSSPLFHAIPNGGSRGDTKESANIAGGKMKAEGVKSGVCDTFLAVPRGSWHGLYIEMKKPAEKKKKGGGISAAQGTFIELAKGQGFAVVVCYSWIEARDVLIEWMNYR